jgi:hypothetical protein
VEGCATCVAACVWLGAENWFQNPNVAVMATAVIAI